MLDKAILTNKHSTCTHNQQKRQAIPTIDGPQKAEQRYESKEAQEKRYQLIDRSLCTLNTNSL